jgi:hypothetical protein
MSSMPADTNPLTHNPCGNIFAHGIDASRDFMTRHAGILKPGPQAFFDKRIAMANAASLNFHAHLPSFRLNDIALYQLQSPLGLVICAAFILVLINAFSY